MPDAAMGHLGAARRSVVLIDEIDKAPRDVPNDILVEVERMQFDIPELARPGAPPVRVALGDDASPLRPIVVFTSNSEKALPDPFLRRCVYHHLEFPPFESELSEAERAAAPDRVTVDTIVSARLGARFQGRGEVPRAVAAAIDFFRYLRGERAGLERRPTLAELLDWLAYLMPQRTPVAEWTALADIRSGVGGAGEERLVSAVANLLLKKPADQARAARLLDDWRRLPPASLS